MIKGAEFSDCRLYRYKLWRLWDENQPYLAVIGLNPSTADETEDDPTIRRCMAYAKAWGYGGLFMINLFAYRATDPKDMKAAAEPIGADNDFHIAHVCANAGMVLAAWGKQGVHQGRADKVIVTLDKVMCLNVNKCGTPAHPLYQLKTAVPFELPITT